MKRNKLISSAVLIAFLLLFIYYFLKNKDSFSALLDLNPLLLAIVGIGFLGLIFINGIFLELLLLPYDKKISSREAFKVALYTSIGNYFGPLLGGTTYRAVYLKKKLELSYTDFLSSLYGYYVISFLTSGLVGILSLVLLAEHSSENGYYILLIFFICTSLALLGIVYNRENGYIYKFFERSSSKIHRLVRKLSASWRKLVKYPGLIRKLILFTLINIVVSAIMNFVEFKMIGVTLNLGSLLLYTVLGIFSILISLTPGALGIREGIYLFSGSVMGVSSSQILLVAVIDRGMQFFVMVFSWLFLLGMKKYKSN